MAAARFFTTEEVREAIFQDSGSEFGGDASDSDFEVSEGNDSTAIGASVLSDDNADSEPKQAAAVPVVRRQRNQPGGRRAEQPMEWEVYEDIDPYESVWLEDYNERQGILFDSSNFAPVDFFKLFMPDAAFDLIAMETNRYAMQYFDDPTDLPPSSRFLKWKDTSRAEVKAFVALQIAMGLCQKPTFRSYWNEYWLTYTPFNSVVSE